MPGVYTDVLIIHSWKWLWLVLYKLQALTALPDIFNKASVVVDLGKVAVFGHSVWYSVRGLVAHSPHYLLCSTVRT